MLAQALEAAETRTEAREALRGLTDGITLICEHAVLRIELTGNLAAMLGATVQRKRPPETGDLSLQSIFGCGGTVACRAALPPIATALSLPPS